MEISPLSIQNLWDINKDMDISLISQNNKLNNPFFKD